MTRSFDDAQITVRNFLRHFSRHPKGKAPIRIAVPQANRDPQFAERLDRYNYRTFDVYAKRVATLAILADGDPNWRPGNYKMEVLGRAAYSLTFCHASC